MKSFPINLSTLLAGGLLVSFLTLPHHALAADSNSLAAALPDVTALTKKEQCSEKQSTIMSSLGLGEMACTISKYVSFDSIGKAVGVSPFQPNSRNNPLNPSDNVNDFVRYSPHFFTRINELYSQDTDRTIYSFLYKHFLIQSTRLFYMTGQDLRDNKKLSTLTLAQYTQASKNSKLLFADAMARCKRNQVLIFKAFGPNYRYTDTFSKCGKSTTASLFWYRRQLDGSSDALFLLLDNVLRTQDKEFYTQLKIAAKQK
jgi:hypothetical protein